MIEGFRRIRLLALLALLALVIGVITIPVSAGAAFASKSPSLGNVTIVGVAGEITGPVWIGQHQGIFNKLGVNVTWLNEPVGANNIPDMLAGAAQFNMGPAEQTITGIQAGAPIRILAMTSVDQPQFIVLSDTVAAAHSIPTTTATTTKAAEAQLLALKGSHITIAESTVGSGSYDALFAVAKQLGLTIGSGANSDFNVETVSSSTLEATAYESGKVQGLGSVPPTTVQPNSVLIPIYLIPPLTVAAGSYLSAPIQEIQQEPKATQAVVTGIVESLRYAKAHAANAEVDTAATLATAGITNPQEQQELYAAQAPFWSSRNPYPTRYAYDSLSREVELAGQPPATLPLVNIIVPRFINATAKQLHIKLLS